MRTIFKAQLTDNLNTCDIQKGARILTVQMQRGIPTLWYECDPKADTEKRLFALMPTGGIWGSLDPNAMKYIGTVQEANLVWHVYEVADYEDDAP
jgi:hypothetical protein